MRRLKEHTPPPPPPPPLLDDVGQDRPVHPVMTIEPHFTVLELFFASTGGVL